MQEFTIKSNAYLSKEIKAFYHQDYTTFGTEGNPDFLNHLKNDFDSKSQGNLKLLIESKQKLIDALKVDLPQIQQITGLKDITVCVIPRAKKESHYSDNQKLFKKVVSDVVDGLNDFTNGTNYILRHTDSKTTHFKKKSEYAGEGKDPYAGITKDTCTISNHVAGKDILLIDDIYTSGVNIDEDAIQALLENGARNVIFYAVGKTYKGRPKNIVISF